MIQLAAPDIRRHWKARKLFLLIPGGWTMNVPEYRLDEVFEQAYIDWFVRDGMSVTRAKQQMEKAVNEHGQAAFRASLFASIVYFAKRYAKMYPERMQPAPRQRKTFVLRGYQPELMQKVHIPGYKPAKQVPIAKRLLTEMKP